MSDAAIPPVGARDHVRGSPEAPVTLVEYGDFQCPHCAAAYPVVKELHRQLGARLRIVFRHFPLTNVHPFAQAAAEAAEWAEAQGAFWAFHDALYEQQASLSGAHLLRLATELGLDRHALAQALEQHTFLPRVKQDFLAAIAAGVKGTPAFFIDGVRHDGPWDLPALTAAIERAQPG
jgi:protein-disulfide isomerase